VAIIRVSILYDEPWLFVCEEHPTNAQLPTLTRPVTPDSCPIYADTRRVAMRGRSIRKDRIERVGWRRVISESPTNVTPDEAKLARKEKEERLPRASGPVDTENHFPI